MCSKCCGSTALQTAVELHFAEDYSALQEAEAEAEAIIICLPMPLNEYREPDLSIAVASGSRSYSAQSEARSSDSALEHYLSRKHPRSPLTHL